MANRYFKTAATTWNSANNWSATASSGSDNAGVPTSADDVFLDAGSGNCTIDVAATCKSITCTGYTRTLQHGAFDLTVAGSLTFVSGMTYTHNNRKITLTTTGATLTSGTQQFYTLALGANSSVTITLGDDVTVVGSLYFITSNSGTLTINTNNIYLTGTLDLSYGTNSNHAGTTIIHISGTGSQTIVCASAGYLKSNTFPVNFTKPSGTLTFVNATSATKCQFGGGVTFTQGTIDFGSSFVHFNSAITYLSQTFVIGTSTIYFNGNLTFSADFLSAIGSFYSVWIWGSAATYTLEADMYVVNFGGISGSNSTTTFNGFTIYISGNYTANINVNTTFNGTTTFIFNGTGNQTISSPSAYVHAINNTVSVVKNSGTMALKNTITYANNLLVAAPNHPTTTTVKKNITYAPNNAYTGTKTAQAALAGL